MRMLSKEAEEVFGMLEQYAGSASIVDAVMARLGTATLPKVIEEIDKERAARDAQPPAARRAHGSGRTPR